MADYLFLQDSLSLVTWPYAEGEFLPHTSGPGSFAKGCQAGVLSRQKLGLQTVKPELKHRVCNSAVQMFAEQEESCDHHLNQTSCRAGMTKAMHS